MDHFHEQVLSRNVIGGQARAMDACVAVYRSDLDEDGQVAFKGSAKAFVRNYAFLSSVLPYTRTPWEERSIFLNFLIPKLPSPEEDDLSRGILEAIDMDSYRVEKQAMQEILLADADAEIDPVPTAGGGGRPEPEIDRLSNILKAFNEHFGDIEWEDADRVRQMITETIPSHRSASKHPWPGSPATRRSAMPSATPMSRTPESSTIGRYSAS